MRWIIFGLWGLLLTGCGGSEKPTVPRPTVGADKADLNLGAVIGQEWMAPGDRLQGEFTADLQFFGYRFQAAAGSTVSVEVTHAGSAAALDTTLFVYGPGVTAQADELAWDDDSGWGKLSRITAVALPGAGTYLVVVGTGDGRGRGRFTVELRCDSTTCVSEDPFECTDFDDWVGDCISETLDAHEVDDCWEPSCIYTRENIDWAFEQCIATEYLDDYRDSLCGFLPPPAPAWCDEPIADFVANRWTPCVDEVSRPDPEDFVWPE